LVSNLGPKLQRLLCLPLHHGAILIASCHGNFKNNKDPSITMKNSGRVLFFDVIKSMQLGKSELEIYNALTLGPMTISDLKKSTRLSERMLRSSINVLMKKEFIKRDVQSANRLKYVYYAALPSSIPNFLKNISARIEEKRQKSRKEILSGMKY